MPRAIGEQLGLVISPLTRPKVAPDVVLIYWLPAQAMRFIQGYMYVEGGVLEFSAAGRIGSCHEGVVKAIVKDQSQVVMLGNGDRIWGGAQDSEVMFACPYYKPVVLAIMANGGAGGDPCGRVKVSGAGIYELFPRVPGGL